MCSFCLLANVVRLWFVYLTRWMCSFCSVPNMIRIRLWLVSTEKNVQCMPDGKLDVQYLFVSKCSKFLVCVLLDGCALSVRWYEQ